MRFEIEIEREEDGRWIAAIPALPGVLAYGASEQEATAVVEALAYRVLADQIERDHKPSHGVEFAIACIVA